LDFCLDGFKTVQNLRYLEDTNLTLEVGIHVFDFMLFLWLYFQVNDLVQWKTATRIRKIGPSEWKPAT
jgi:hypothetical protein